MVGAPDLGAVYAACEAQARAHYENFPVASILVPRALRGHIAALYAFARTADDFADEGNWSAAERQQLLDGWERRLLAAAASRVAGPVPAAGEPANSQAIFLALGASIRTLGLPVHLFERLLSAFRQDVTVGRYATWQDLLDYCRRSANPVGRLVLRISGYSDARLDAWSDAVCTALQLTNFWQDMKADAARGRVYLPEGETVPAAVARTRALFQEGRPVCNAVRGRLRFELRATWLGGVRILDRIEQSGFDVISRRPTLTARDMLWIAPRLLS